MVVGSLFGWSKATELNVSATSDTVLPDLDDVVDALSGKVTVGGILSERGRPDDELSGAVE